MKKLLPLLLLAVALALAITASAESINFTTFVTQTQLSTAMGDTSVIGYTYAGNKFVGSFYPSDNRLYSTDLSGGNVQAFGSVPNASGEVVVASSLGHGGFGSGQIYAGSGANGQIYSFANGGGAATLFATLPGDAGVVRGLLFDPGNTFGGNLLVTTTSGKIYEVTSGAVATQLTNFNADTEGMDILGNTFGIYSGDLIISSEGLNAVYVVDPNGTQHFVGGLGGAETISYVPTNLGSGDPSLEGFYGANYFFDIIKADPSQFTQTYSQLGNRNLLGDVIVNSETGGGVYDIHWNGSGFDSLVLVGNYPNQPEDGIFVTAQRIQDITTPEPGSILLLGTGILGMAGAIRRKIRR